MDRRVPTSELDVSARAEELYQTHRSDIFKRVDKLFATLMVGQWLVAILLSLVYSPYAWAGKQQTVHAHVYAAVFLGGLISSLPLLLIYLRPGAVLTRHVVACAQILWSALLIHLSGGRVETHFHVFGSLAFLAFYRDWHVLVPATLLAATEHFLRQLYWPESVYGVPDPEWWRFIEHSLWALFMDAVLIQACLRGQKEMREIAGRQALVEALSDDERHRSDELAESQEALRTEKLVAVGKLAASVGHELRNPLTALRNANAVLQKRLAHMGSEQDSNSRLLVIIDRELNACNRIISDLLDFARERALRLEPTELHGLVDESLALLPTHHVSVQNQVSEQLPQVLVDRAQFRQVLINLVQNAVEAVPEHRDGHVVVSAVCTARGNLELVIEDSGEGMSEELVQKIFEPLFTTKVKGTGLGMAIVASILKQHQAEIRVQSAVDQGTRITIALPAVATVQAA